MEQHKLPYKLAIVNRLISIESRENHNLFQEKCQKTDKP